MALFGLFEHGIVSSAKRQGYEPSEVQAVFHRYDDRNDEFDVGIVYTNERYIRLESYASERDADKAANALADHFEVGVTS